MSAFSRKCQYRLRTGVAVMLFFTATLAACRDLLTVDDPTAVLESEVNDASGAELMRRGALLELFSSVGRAAWDAGLLADEFRNEQLANVTGSTDYEHIDRRSTADQLSTGYTNVTAYRGLQVLRLRTAVLAREKLRSYAPMGARQAHVGEMFAVGGFAALRIAEDFCPGFPFHELNGLAVSLGSPMSTVQALEYALAAFDSAASYAGDSARVLNFARVGRGRALLQLGRFAEAAAAVATVPSSYTYRTEYNAALNPTNILAANRPEWTAAGDPSIGKRSIADSEGGTGLNFVSANDARVTTISRGLARDGQTGLHAIGKYVTGAAPMVLASGVEARLIEAEAALRANDPNWLVILNSLRANEISPAMSALTDPGTPDQRLDLVFRERAFWLFGTGTRLGDLRRLVRVYSRAPNTVFPSGTYWRGGPYGTLTSLPFDTDRSEESFGSGIAGCTGS